MKTRGLIGPSRPRPTFLWQGLLIVLPVIVMAGYCFVALRQDKLVAQQEAVQRATAIADNLLPKIRAALEPELEDEQLEGRCFAVNAAGELIFPAPYSRVPTPEPLDPTELSVEQAQLWQISQNFGNDVKDRSAALVAVKAFLETSPPTRFAAAGQYRLGLLLAEQKEMEAAADAFTAIFEKEDTFRARNENGVPWRFLAWIKLLELEARTGAGLSEKQQRHVDALCLELLQRPTLLTPLLLEKIGALTPQAAEWEVVWRQEELLRDLYAISRPDFHSGIFAGSGQVTVSNRFLSSATNLETVKIPEMFWVPALTLADGTIFPVDRKGTAELVPIEVDPEHWLLTHWDQGADQVSPLEERKTRIFGQTVDEAVAKIKRRSPNAKMIVSTQVKRSRNRFIGGTWEGEALIGGFDMSTNHWFVYRTESEIGSRIAPVLDEAGPVPDYFSVEVQVAGRTIKKSMPDRHLWQRVSYSGKTGGIRKEVTRDLATNVLASAVQRAQGKELLAVNVLLTSPSALFEQQTTRSFWIGTLIGISALAALSGLIAAWRAFQRQIQLTEMKSQFVSSVSHELRAPIASVRLLAESLERGKIQGPDKQNEYFKFIGQECRRLSALIENVLDFSRIDQGRKQYELEPTDLAALVQQTVRLMETYAAEKQVKLELALSEAMVSTRPQANLDGKAIQQALVNLVDNAIKHSAPGQVVRVGLEREEVSTTAAGEVRTAGRPGPQRVDSSVRHGALPASAAVYPLRAGTARGPDSAWLLWVEDNGPGIAPEEQEKIFERFYRCGSELRRETQGVGIGLSIVKHVVEAHGGRVQVKSVVGEGSRFTIYLPAPHDDGDESAGDDRPQSSS